MKVYFAADHAGFAMKNMLLNFVRGEMHLEVEDCGAFELDTSDSYPGIIACAARSLAQDIQSGIESRAILLGASGQGEAMVANRFKGVRAAVYYGEAHKEQIDVGGQGLDILTSSREHNDANALSLGARFLSEGDAKTAVQKWLSHGFSGDDRHAKRIRAIDSVA